MKGSLFVLAIPLCLCAACAAGPKSVTISDAPQLFLDDYVIAKMSGLRREIRRPRRHPANPMIVQDKPWETRMIEIYGTVLYDPRIRKYRCWYLATESDSGVPDTPEAPGTAEYYQCYAESDDGITWTKPAVGAKAYGRHKKHNIVIRDAHGFCVLSTPDDPDPAKRYRGIGGNTLGFSPDGVVWDIRTRARKNWARAVRKNDTSSCVVFWKGEYLAFVRNQEPERRVMDPKTGIEWRGVQRGVGLCISKDFVHWTPKKSVFKSDKKDNHPWTQPYGICVTPYGDVLIGLVPMLYLVPEKGNNGYGPMDVQMAVSRDGRQWRRVANRSVFIRCKKRQRPQPWDLLAYPSTTMFVRNDTVHIYYTGINIWHGESRRGKGVPYRRSIGLATLPADRFVALTPAGDAEGVLVTKSFLPPAGDLLVNAELRDPGDLSVELLDARGAVLKGFDRRHCRLTPADKLRYRVHWNHGEGVIHSWSDAVRREARALRFILRGRAQFYAFQLIDRDVAEASRSRPQGAVARGSGLCHSVVRPRLSKRE